MIPIRLYQPSNATEGDWFFGRWCSKCARDKAMREGIPIEECDDNERCDIIPRTMLFNPDDEEYPQEWRYDGDRPVCTAFVPAGEPIPPPRCEKTLDLLS